jgi:VWFA-related protein
MWSVTMSPLPSFVLCLGLWSVVGFHGLQQLVEPPILSVKTDLVTLAVTVVDRTGVPVAGLRREHFTVYDNGEPQAIQFFTSEDLPATIGLIVDSSASTRGRRDVVTSAADAFAAMRHLRDEFFTLNFNEVVWPGLPPSVAFTDDTDQLRAALSTAPAQGMTALYDALDRALDHLQFGTRDRKALIVVSDGGDNASSQTLDVIVERARRTSVVIYSVTLFNPDDRDSRPHVLRKLARETGGHAFTPRRAEDVGRSFAQVAREIRSGYTLGFTPADTAEGGFRSIRVVADAGGGRQLIARTRAGYYARPTGRTGE